MGYGRRRTPTRAAAQYTRSSPSSLETHLVRGHWTPVGCGPKDTQYKQKTQYYKISLKFWINLSYECSMITNHNNKGWSQELNSMAVMQDTHLPYWPFYRHLVNERLNRPLNGSWINPACALIFCSLCRSATIIPNPPPKLKTGTFLHTTIPWKFL